MRTIKILLMITLLTTVPSLVMATDVFNDKTDSGDKPLKIVKVDYNGEEIPFVDYLSVYSEGDILKMVTLDGKYCYFNLDYEKKSFLSLSHKVINITKYENSYYFTTDSGVEVNTMNYLMDCKGFDINFKNNSLYLDNISIDFNGAYEEQNISTSYDRINNKLVFTAVEGSIADLSFIDPDVTLYDEVHTNFYERTPSKYLLWKSTLVGYVFYINGSSDLIVTKTTDGGAIWTDVVSVDNNGAVEMFDIWFDQWSVNDTGNIVHIVYTESNLDDLIYNTFDTTDDSVGSGVQIMSTTIISSDGNWGDHDLSIIKARGENLYVGLMDLNDCGVWKSINNGASWSSVANIDESCVVDRIRFQPGAEADANDFVSLYQDVSTNQITLKTYDQSGDSWSESSVITEVAETTLYSQWSTATRHSDNHTLLAVWNLLDSASGDLLFFDIESASSITQKTDINTDTDDSFQVGILINQQNDDIYIAYLGKSDGSEVLGTTVNAYYKKSSNGGTSWGSETLLSETYDDLRLIAGGTSINNNGGKWMPIWFNDDLNDLNANYGNSINVSASEDGDTCTCAGLNTNWEIDMLDNCVIMEACDLGTGKLSFINSGNFTCDAQIKTTNLGDPGSGGIVWINDQCELLVY